jgi:hypothetical protein
MHVTDERVKKKTAVMSKPLYKMNNLCYSLQQHAPCADTKEQYTRWFKYDQDYLCVNKSQFVPVIFEPPCTYTRTSHTQPMFTARYELNI